MSSAVFSLIMMVIYASVLVSSEQRLWWQYVLIGFFAVWAIIRMIHAETNYDIKIKLLEDEVKELKEKKNGERDNG